MERDVESFNFEMIYDEYREFVTTLEASGKGREVLFKKAVALKVGFFV